MTERVYILLGSNLGDREKNLESALDKISNLNDVHLVSYSGIYESPASEMEPGSPDFLNQAVEILTESEPLELLKLLESIEKEFGRTDKGMNKSRIIDLDILLFGGKVIESKLLFIPYRQLLNRPFAMIPLVEIAPDIVHPVIGELIRDYIDDSDHQTVKPLHEYAAE